MLGASTPNHQATMKLALLIATIALTFTLQGEQQTGHAKPAALAAGQNAPTFQLNDHNGDSRRIGGKQKTWTVLAFFPKALTPG